MRRLTKTTLVVLAIVAGAAAKTLAQKANVRLDPISTDVYQLTYQNRGGNKVNVQIIDEEGKILHSELIKVKKSITKRYSFQNLNSGEYSFKIMDAEGTYVTKINRSNEINMVAAIIKMEDQKAKVIVKGEIIGPVNVNIFDKYGVMVFDDYIDRESGFSRVYDLSKVKSDELSIEVVAANELLATAEF